MATINDHKNKKSKFNADGYSFDSLEEIEFYFFLRDALKLKLITEYVYQPDSLVICPKATITQKIPYKRKSGYKTITSTLYSEAKYTPDFKFKATDKLFHYFPQFKNLLRETEGKWFYIDVKGAYNRYGGDRQFSLHRKLVFHLFQIHINKVIPQLFFQKLGAAPDDVRWMKNRKVPTLKKAYIATPSLEEVVNDPTNKTTDNIEEKEINISFLKAPKKGKKSK